MKKTNARRWTAGLIFAACFLSWIVGLTPSAEAMGRKPKTFPVEVRVDFGPAGKAALKETIEVEKGTTPKEAVSQVAPIMAGKTCCSFREILAIDGVAVDPAKNRWWTCSLNGSKKGVSPRKTKLKRGDLVEWKYIQDEQ